MNMFHKIAFTFSVLLLLASSGCQIPALMSKPTRDEKKIPAEYNLKAQSDKKLLILVNQPSWSAGPANLKPYLTKAIQKNIQDNKILKADNFVTYDGRTDYVELSPRDSGKAAGADLVLVVAIEQQSVRVEQIRYYRGLLTGRAQLIDVASGAVLWPNEPDGKNLRIEFDLERNGYDAAVSRLANSFAHCVVRYFYDCSVAKFQIFDDKSQPTWQLWED